MSNERGQVAGYDTLISFFLFLLIFVFVQQIWNSEYRRLLEEQFENQRIQVANQALDSLVSSRGYPADWNADNLQMAGMATSPGVLDTNKTQHFFSLPYSTARRALTLDAYDFFLILDSSIKNEDLNLGTPPSNQKTTVAVTRNVTYKEKIAYVRLQLFH